MTIAPAEATAATPAVEARDLWVGYDQRPILEGVSFKAPKGSVVGVVGRNGSGKTTLLKALLGLLPLWRGQAFICGLPPKQGRQFAGYMPQKEAVDWDFPVSVLDVVMMGRYGRLGLIRRPQQRDRDLAMRALETVGMEEYSPRLIGELSGGQQRRVLIARVLAREAQVLLLDEPTAGLDVAAQHDLLQLIGELKLSGHTVLFTTHDLSCVATSCDYACCVNKKVIAFGSPQEVMTPEVLQATFESHLLMFNLQGQVYATHDR